MSRRDRRSSIKSLLYTARHCYTADAAAAGRRDLRRRHGIDDDVTADVIGRILADGESIRPSVNRPIVRRRSRRANLAAADQSSKATAPGLSL